LLVGLEGQYSPDVLFAAEQFGYGGAAIGRAFNSSELTGDQGVSAYAEFNRTLSPPLESLQWFAFVDGGRVWGNDPSVTDDHGGSSYGGGIRWNARHLASTLTIAQPLSLAPSIPVGGQDNGPRVLMTVQMRY
jgi:hemolysin activation/secretion protein